MKREYIIIGSLVLVAALLTWFMRQKLAAVVDRATTPDNKLLWPVPGFRHISSPYAEYRIHPVTGVNKPHKAIDIGDRGIGDITNADVVASDNGVVEKTQSGGAGGNELFIKHDNGVIAGYAHLNKVLVTKGQRVTRGQLIAKVGSTGTSTSSHLHFTLTDPFGEKLNPELFLA